MTAKWIYEVEQEFNKSEGWESIHKILERINRLLKVAGIQSEDPNISDRIQEETKHVTNGRN